MSCPSIEHIENNKLFTDLQYRFNYVCKFVGFGEEDIKYIHESASVLAPLVPTIVDRVYVKLFSFDITKKVFLIRNDQFSGKMETSLDELSDTKSEQIKFRKDMLSKYLVKLVTADYSSKGFLNYLDWVGKIHTAKAGNKKIIVDYIHINALFGYVSDVIFELLYSCTQLSEEQRIKTIQAFNKLLWIQNDLFTKHYVHDEERNGIVQPNNNKTHSENNNNNANNKTHSEKASSGGCCFAFGSSNASSSDKTITSKRSCPHASIMLGMAMGMIAVGAFFLGKYFAL
ncbi:hypothetical protein FDP41_001340 [Naegleria fowleri]|uniref:Globin-sensor domain-containing protein n=1 Tax=Naegleria fowleri TaxID=5763 RepID=A0A6A5BYI3_NAEFO|nr:uncharacterized protein FDP41_001340 [Naegleria fowleri]KAF0979672.1 hypothetical protein FDP41_001340 [Naegleria fowleri]CAG4718973.1 unnamed protein product [Naegleria fowleri]